MLHRWQSHSSHAILCFFPFRGKCEKITSHYLQAYNGFNWKRNTTKWIEYDWRREIVAIDEGDKVWRPQAKMEFSRYQFLRVSSFCLANFDGFIRAHRILTATGQQRERQSSNRNSLFQWLQWWWSHNCTLPCVATLLYTRSLAEDQSKRTSEL